MKYSQKIIFSILIFILPLLIFGQITPQISPSTTVVTFGDSLVVGVGATGGGGFVSILSTRIGHPIVNAGASGDTTTTALARLDRDVVSLNPDIVILFLGGNDILNGVPQATIINNLRTIIQNIQQSGAKVILVGIHGSVFNPSFETSFNNLATETGAGYVPNVLMGILGNPSLLSDPIHPNNAGYQLIADRIFPVLQTTINSLPNQSLTVTCSPNSTTAEVGQTVIWTAFATGGAGNYTYGWTGSDGLSGTGSSVTKTYPTEGVRSASVTVTSGGQQVTSSCSSVNIRRAPTIAFCSVSVSNALQSGYFILWNSSFLGNPGTSSPQYTWTGTDGLSANLASINHQYTTLGNKEGTVNIRAGTETIPLTCSADVNVTFPPDPSRVSLGGSCNPQVNGMTVTWNVVTTGGSTSTPPVVWTGSDGLSTTSRNAVMTYTTEGTKTASVLINSGTESLRLTCQAKIADTGGSNRCFIATAVFGTDMAPEVMVLRKFRDKSLLPNKVGKIFVETYYSVSPPIADFIRPRESLKAVVRAGLTPMVYILEHMGYEETVD